ncbi:MAG: hypothetical protein IRY86_12360 [Thermorudis peleae]|nr:hypothetical protein [Thermorudis peleae]
MKPAYSTLRQAGLPSKYAPMVSVLLGITFALIALDLVRRARGGDCGRAHRVQHLLEREEICRGGIGIGARW